MTEAPRCAETAIATNRIIAGPETPERSAQQGTPEAERPPALPNGRVLSAPQFWALMEHWAVPDPVALELIAFPGKMPRSGKRPRFRLLSSQQRMTTYLVEIDAALAAVGFKPGWLHRNNRRFDGGTPLDVMIRAGMDGATEVLRELNRMVLKKALKT